MKKFGILGVATLLATTAMPAMGQMHGADLKVTEVPLRVEQGVLVVTVESSDGDEYDFILGSASGATVLSQSAKARIGDATLSMAGVPASTEGAQDVSDDKLTYDGTSFDGIIGANSLNAYDVLVDAPGGRVVFKAPGRSVSWDGMELSEPTRLMVFHGMIMTVDVGLNGHTSRALLDLGTRKLVLSPPLSEKASMAAESVQSMSIGGTTFTGLPVQVQEHPVFKAFDPQGNGFAIVGAPIALDCAISFSFVHQEIRTCVR